MAKTAPHLHAESDGDSVALGVVSLFPTHPGISIPMVKTMKEDRIIDQKG